MPPKAAKKGSAKKSSAAGAAGGNKNWEAGLTRAEFEEESWRACVSFVVGRSPEDEELIRALALAAQQPLRKLFSWLTWDSTLAKIHELGNPKAKRPDDVPLFYEVTEPAKVLLDAGEEIPCDLMAKILKFQLLQIKANDQQRREAEQTEEVKTKAGPPASGKDKGGAKGPDKKGKSPPSPVGNSKEKKTKLKRRDDVEPPEFIDDEPEDGPQHYILVLGFHQPHLVAELDAIGVHVASVIKLCSEPAQTSEGQQEQHTSEGSEQSLRASPVLDADDHGGVELAAQARKLDLFWSGLRSVLDSGPLESKLHDVAQLNYTVPDLSPPFHTQDPEVELKMGIQIFEGVVSLVYDCLDWRRHHEHYRNNMRLISVATVVELDPQPAEVLPTPLPMTPHSKKKLVREENPPQETEELPLSPDVDMRYYSNLLDLVPPDACSVPLILHCMLEQVVISTEQSSLAPSHVSEEPKPHSGPGLDHELVSFMLQSFLPLVHTKEERSHMLTSLLTTAQNEEDKKRLAETFGAEETQKKSEQPLVIRHHDERALRLRDVHAVEVFDPLEVELSMMRLSPVWELIHSAAQQRDNNLRWMSIKQQLQHFCTDDVVPWLEVERLFHQSVFETSYAKMQLNNRRTKGQTFLTDDPADTEQRSGRVCTQLELSDIQSCRLRSLFDWHYAEHHNASIFPQVLQLASEEYRCLDTFRGSHNKILYIFCHNPMSPYHQCKEFWDVALHTDVKFRKYLEYVADTISDWTKEEELKREAMQVRDVSPAEPPKDERTTDSAEEDDTLEPVIRKDSLKAWKLEQERLKEEEAAKKLKENVPKGKQRQEDAKSTDKKSKTSSDGKKSQAATARSSAKTPREPVTPPVEENEELQPAEEPVKAFTGYSMDGKLIHVSGRVQYLFPSDGGHITVETVSYVEGSSLMKVAVKKDGHNFYTHINQVVSAKPPPKPQDKESNSIKEDVKVSEPVMMKRVKQGSLSAVLDNGIHLSYSFYGPTGEHIVSPQVIEGVTPETSTLVPIPLSSSTHRSKGTDLDSVPSKTQSPSSYTRPPESQSKVCEGQPASPSRPFNSLNLSVPNGLLLQFLREDTRGVSSEEQGMLVKQGFPLHGRGVVGQLRDPFLSKELSRVITSHGAVIRNMRDGSTEVLFADGSVSFSQDSGPVWVPDSEVEEEHTSQEADNKEGQSVEKEADAQRGCWLTTTPSGARIYTVGTTHKHIPTTPLLAFKTTDPITHEVMLSREDLVVSVQNPDGSLSVEHADGTRITSLYQDKPPKTLQHILRHTGEKPESVTLRSTSECVCGCTECVCVTRCADSINESVHIQDTCDKEEEISREEEAAGQGRESSVYEDGEESMSGAENGKKSVCESDKGSVSTKERVVLVEKEGCATVVMYPERHTAHAFLADGTVITGNNQGAYQVFPFSTGLLQIQSDGTCVYSSDPLETPSPKGGTPANQPGSYTMSHTGEVACDITDADGNHFQVMQDGQLSVLNYSPAPSTLKQDEEEPDEEEDREMSRINVKHREHCPRLFMVHEDGSGTELLSSQTVEELLYQAYSDPTIALLKEPLPDTQDEFGITILKPSHQNVWSQWLLGKQNPDITPPNLRNRSWHDFPRTEEKSPGPPLGTDMARGLTLSERSGGSAAQRQPVRSCPKVLEVRELYQHRPFTTLLKNTIDARLKEYIETLMEREQQSEEMKIKEPRTEEESVHASDLLNLVLSFAEEEDAGHTFDKRTSEDIVSLYNRGVGGSTGQSDASEDTATVTSNSFTSGKESKWTERLAQHRQEMCEEQAYREALRKKNIVPYFHLENIPLYQNLLEHQTPDMRSRSMDVPPIPKSDSADGILKDTPQESTPRPLNPTPSQSTRQEMCKDQAYREALRKKKTVPFFHPENIPSHQNLLQHQTPDMRSRSIVLPPITKKAEAFLKDVPQENTARPFNPTPSQSASHTAGSDRKLEKRPTNPTPQAAGESSQESSSGRCKSVLVDVTGKPRRTKVRLPTSILSSKPCSVPNQQFLSVEEPVRRKCRTISLTDPNVIARGFQLLPSSVDFGTLQEGTSSAITVRMKNCGCGHLQVPSETASSCYRPPGHLQSWACGCRLYDIWLKDRTGSHNKKGSRVRQLSSSLPGGKRDRTVPHTTPPDRSFSKHGTP
ncbi:Sperm-associated antigen 17 Projection protein PF6-like protein [Larimichthys crocea]|uniref:Sperm-associated antigen 17 Projection protein PF6-like protein n=1 Tax=Larimichthys crocea TaxID=215358 RepID=A0A6G0HIJ9_LARCR|nr:Sperm-associated antigen 17 Projection protein PF6-like protein [Larimichthys crocea]